MQSEKPKQESITEPTEGAWRYEYRGPWQQHVVTNLPGETHNILIADLGTCREVDANGYLLAASKKLKDALLEARKVIRQLNRGGAVVGRSVTKQIDQALAATSGPKQAWISNPDRRPKEKPERPPEAERMTLEELLSGLNPLEKWLCEERGRQMRVFHYSDYGNALSMTGHKIIWRVDLEETDTIACCQSFSDVAYRGHRRVTTYSANGETMPEALVAALKAAQKGDAIPL